MLVAHKVGEGGGAACLECGERGRNVDCLEGGEGGVLATQKVGRRGSAGSIEGEERRECWLHRGWREGGGVLTA